VTKILLADDVQLYLALEKTFLARRDYEFLTATRGPDAWELLSSHRPQLSIVELDLPGMGALELRQQQLEVEDLAGIPMVVTTSDAGDSLRQRARSLGISSILAKPFNLDALTRAVEAVLPARRRRHQRHQTHLDVSLQIENSYRDGSTLDVSQCGMLIVVDEPLSLGQSVTVQVTLPGQEPLRVKARVVRYAKERRPGQCYGLELLELPSTESAALSAYLATRNPGA
jgi:CheY-like chemotaxis protein